MNKRLLLFFAKSFHHETSNIHYLEEFVRAIHKAFIGRRDDVNDLSLCDVVPRGVLQDNVVELGEEPVRGKPVRSDALDRVLEVDHGVGLAGLHKVVEERCRHNPRELGHLFRRELPRNVSECRMKRLEVCNGFS